MRIKVLGPSLMLLAAATACGPLPATEKRVATTPKVTATPTPGTQIAQVQATLVGDVRGPAGLISNNGGSVIANNGGSIISEHGGGLIGKTKYRPLAIADVPYAGVEVFVAGATGQAIPTFKRVTTDADGKFAIAGVPPGGLYLLVARFTATDGSQKVLQTLVKTSSTVVTAHLTAASSFVAAALVQGQQDLPGDLDPAVFDRATRATAASLTDEDVKLIGNNAAMAKRMDDLAAAIADLKADLGSLKAQIAKLQQDVDLINQKIDKILATPTPAPTAPPATVTLVSEAFDEIAGLAADGQGKVYVADVGKHNLSALSGEPATVSVVDLALAKPTAVAATALGDVYVADVDAGAPVIRYSTTGAPPFKLLKPTGPDASKLSTISGLAVDPAKGTVYVTDANWHRLFQLDRDGTITMLAGSTGTATPFGPSATGEPGYQDGKGTDARFNEPVGIVLGSTALIADRKNNALRAFSLTGTISTFAGQPPDSGFKDGSRDEVRFNAPQGVAMDENGNIFVADTGNQRIRTVLANGQWVTFAGSGTAGDADGPAATAQFTRPLFVAAAPKRRLYVAEKTRIRLVTY